MNAESPEKQRRIDPRYYQPLSSAVFASTFLKMFCCLFLDMGQRTTGCNIALAGFWTGVALILLRRPHSPTRVDLAYVRFAATPFVFATILLYLKTGGWLHTLGQELTARIVNGS